MKVVAYHYVRPAAEAEAGQYVLDLDDFRRQLDYFACRWRPVDDGMLREALRTGTAPRDRFLLTFDDGLSDHLGHVLPELVARGWWGLFFVSTATLDRERLLDVHRIHYLAGACEADEILRTAEDMIEDDMMQGPPREDVVRHCYPNQAQASAETRLKRLLNYDLTPAARAGIVDALFARFARLDEAACARTRYLGPDDVKAIADAGMGIGLHSHTHPVMSYLDAPSQGAEIRASRSRLSEIVGPMEAPCFCHPYGGRFTYDDTTARTLAELGFACAFRVEPEDVTDEALAGARFALPRYDCNLFPHGTATRGRARPAYA